MGSDTWCTVVIVWARNLTTSTSISMPLSRQKKSQATRLVFIIECNSARGTATMIIGPEIDMLQNMVGKVASGSIVANASEQITRMPHRPMIIRSMKLIGYVGMPGMEVGIH